MRKNFKTTITTTLLALAMILSLTACGSKTTDNQGAASAPDSSNTVTEAPVTETPDEGTVILTDGGLSISYTGTTTNPSNGLGLNFRITNTTGEVKNCDFGKVYVDGIVIYPTATSVMTAQPGGDATGSYFFNSDALASVGITDVSTVDVQFVYTNASGETTVSEPIAIETGIAKTTDNNLSTEGKGFVTVYDKDGILVEAKYIQSTKYIYAVMKNTSDSMASTSCAVTALNDSQFPAHYCGATTYEYFMPGETVFGAFHVYDAFLGLTAPIEKVTLDVVINNDSFVTDIPVEK